MIRPCTPADFDTIIAIINEAAEAYRGVIPSDCWHDPYMPAAALASEIAAGVEFSGFDDSGALIGAMGIQAVRDVFLIRHAYVRTANQNRGIGGQLLRSLIDRTTAPLLVGTWADAVLGHPLLPMPRIPPRFDLRKKPPPVHLLDHP